MRMMRSANPACTASYSARHPDSVEISFAGKGRLDLRLLSYLYRRPLAFVAVLLDIALLAFVAVALDAAFPDTVRFAIALVAVARFAVTLVAVRPV